VWRAGADKGEVRRVTWVCGDQPVLVEEVIDTTRAQLQVSELDIASFTGGVDLDRSIWAAANQYPLAATARRLVLVRAAEKVKNWEPLEGWIAASRRLPNNYLLFASGDDDFPYLAGDGRRAGLKPHVELIKNKGRIVRCTLPNQTDLVAWAHRRAPTLDEPTLRHLLHYAGGNLSAVATVAGKLAVLNGTAGPRTVEALCDESPADTFADSLLSLNKRAALLHAETLDERDLPRLISHLDSRLDLLAQLWRATQAGLSPREVQGQPIFLVHRYLPIAKHYDPRKCVNCRRVLAVCDEAVKSGARIGLIEALVALW